MFQGLRQGAPIFILHKAEPKLEIGEVVNVSNPAPMYPTTFNQNSFLPQMIVDIKARICDADVTFEKVRADLSIADTNAGSIVISDNREAMISEIESLDKQTDQRLSEMPKLQHVKEECPKMLAMLSPQIQRETRQAQELENLKRDVSSMNDRFDDLERLIKTLGRNPKQKDE